MSEFYQRTRRVRFKNSGTSDKKSPRKFRYNKIPRVHLSVFILSESPVKNKFPIKIRHNCKNTSSFSINQPCPFPYNKGTPKTVICIPGISLYLNFNKSRKSPASIAKSNKQWVGTCLYQEGYKPLLINCEAVIWL